MASSNLKWVYGSTHRAQDVSNDAVDEYKSIIQQLYLDQNMTREEVLSHLKDVHGFSLSMNQFSKATKRWGFYKQPRHVQKRMQPSESITKEEEAPNPPDELFDFEPDVLDSIDENEAYLGSGDENVADSQILEDVQGQFSDTGKSLVSKPPPSLNHSQLPAMDVGFPCEASPFGTNKSLPESSNRQSEQLEAARKLETVLHSNISKMFTRVSLHDFINKSRVDYLTCCYCFEAAVGCLERSGKSVDTLEHQVPRSDTDKLSAQYRRDRDKILASPDSSLDMWSIRCLLEVNQCHTMDNLLDRLDITDLQFMTAVRACLRLCAQWIDLVVKGMPKGALQFDSLFLHQNAGEAIQNICRPIDEQSRFDIWQEAGYLFAFIWSNEQRETANSWSWFDKADISGLSPTYFLAIICQIIVYETAQTSPDFRTISGKGDDAGEPICRLYLQTIGEIKTSDRSRALKGVFTWHFLYHFKSFNLDPKQRKDLENVQCYQRTAEDFVYGEERDNLAQEVSQALKLHGDVRVTSLGSLASGRSINSVSYSSSPSYPRQQYLTLLSSNPTMTRSLASGSSRGSSLNSFRAFQAASRAMATGVKEDQGALISSIKE